MLTNLVLILGLLSSSPDEGKPTNMCAALMSAVVAAPVCQSGAGLSMFDDDITTFLAGGESFLNRWFYKLEQQGRLDEVIAHLQRTRDFWRKGKAKPAKP
jgi:hypothetical protein